MEPSSSSEQPLSVFDRVNRWTRTSTMLKLVVIGILVVVLLIPTVMLQSLISERESTRNAAVAEVSAKWGNEQVIGGPILTVPYEIAGSEEDGPVQTAYAHFLPDELQFDGRVRPEQRNRGIFVVTLYNTRLTIKGKFKKPSVASLGLSASQMQWEKAVLSLGISDVKGIREAVTFRLNGQSIDAEPGIGDDGILPSGVSVPLALNADAYAFETTLNLNGSTQLSFLPLGKETRVHLQSPWPTPSFTGSYLPDKRRITASGFEANWKVLQFNRNFPQQGIGNFLTKLSAEQARNPSYQPSELPSFGVKLLLPVDEYQKTMRSAKYGIMFVMLTFIAFFFVEILDRRRIHPFSICWLVLLSVCFICYCCPSPSICRSTGRT